jgi:hypothetical protein
MFSGKSHKKEIRIQLSKSEAGSEMALPFLFTSFGNHRLSDHLSIEE